MSDRQETIVAIATPPGSGGIGVIRLSGPDSHRIASKVVNIPIKPRYAHYCEFRDDQGRNIDQGILIYFKKPNSYTGEDVIEFQGHGGQAVLSLLLKQTLVHGARLAKPGEFTERAYLNGRIDLIQAEAIADLISAASVQAARSAARSLEGEFSRQINSILEQLVGLRVFVESSLDFPEEEIEFIERFGLRQKLSELINTLEVMLIKTHKGSLLRRGIRVVIAGKPNTGKSSLLNYLTRTDRAIVTHIAGTTRDTIEDTILADGIIINLVDTAGIRETQDIVEQEGVRRSLAEAEKADVIIWMTDDADDARDPLKPVPGSNKAIMLVVHNKIDLFNREPATEFVDGVPNIYISVKTGQGIELLEAMLKDCAGQQETGEDVILARERHIKALEAGKQYIERAVWMHDQAVGTELLAEELNRAQLALAEITGVFHAEDLLGEIFSKFCIGK